MNISREQKLIDICFSIAITLHMHQAGWKDASIEEVAEWVATQLQECGFPTHPVGMSWGVLEKESETERLKKIRDALEEAALAIYEAGRE